MLELATMPTASLAASVSVKAGWASTNVAGARRSSNCSNRSRVLARGLLEWRLLPRGRRPGENDLRNGMRNDMVRLQEKTVGAARPKHGSAPHSARHRARRLSAWNGLPAVNVFDKLKAVLRKHRDLTVSRRWQAASAFSRHERLRDSAPRGKSDASRVRDCYPRVLTQNIMLLVAVQ